MPAHSHDAALPLPDADAQAHSLRVRAAVVDAIAAAEGFITLEEYMRIVLYAPGLGYYVAGARKFGRDGDFVTAPELTPLFGGALARQVGQVLRATGGRHIVELGAGSGALAADMLESLAQADLLPDAYTIVEVSPELRERQRATLRGRGPAIAERVVWRDDLPASVHGAVVMNEVLDAVPPRVVVRRDGGWLERGVSFASGALALCDRALVDASLIARAEERFPPDIDYASEVNPAAEALVADLARRVKSGAMIIVDYGYTRGEYYHPQRTSGTLMGHYRHRAHDDPLWWPGLCDLTAHVDFTAMADAAEAGGLHVAGYASQAAFLLGCGILDLLARTGAPDRAAYLRAAAAVQQLTSPADMGERFKVLALASHDEIAWPGFAISNRADRL